MSHSVTLMPSGQQFQVEADETLLAAGLRQGFALPYGCRDGACGACKGRIVSGTVDHGKAQAGALTDEERRDGMTLFCCARPTSDLVVHCRESAGAPGIAVKTLPARIQRMTRLAVDVMAIDLKLPANDRLQFRAGQYVDILLKDGRRRSFSIANAPHDDEYLQLHIRHVPGGVFTDHVFGSMKERDILRINGPLGAFCLHESTRPVIFVAGGTGFAPIKAMIEHAMHAGSTRPMRLYWGARNRAGLYLNDLAQDWAERWDHLEYTPVLSDARSDSGWTGRTGLVHRAVAQDFPDLSPYQVYVCGAPAMIDAARSDFTRSCHLAIDDFHADAFSFAADGAIA